MILTATKNKPNSGDHQSFAMLLRDWAIQRIRVFGVSKPFQKIVSFNYKTNERALPAWVVTVREGGRPAAQREPADVS